MSEDERTQLRKWAESISDFCSWGALYHGEMTGTFQATIKRKYAVRLAQTANEMRKAAGLRVEEAEHE